MFNKNIRLKLDVKSTYFQTRSERTTGDFFFSVEKGQKNDKLQKSHTIHIENNETLCNNKCNCDKPTNLVLAQDCIWVYCTEISVGWSKASSLVCRGDCVSAYEDTTGKKVFTFKSFNCKILKNGYWGKLKYKRLCWLQMHNDTTGGTNIRCKSEGLLWKNTLLNVVFYVNMHYLIPAGKKPRHCLLRLQKS